MSNTIKEGDVVDIYYVSPQKCFKDIGTVISVNSFEYASLLADYSSHIPELMIAHAAVEAIREIRGEIIIKFKKVKKAIIKKRVWPVFFSELLKGDTLEKRDKRTIEVLTPYTQLGHRPPSADIYSQATKELWSIQVTYSEALRAELRSAPGLLPLISSCKNNNNLVAKICVADPERLLPKIADTEINALYGGVEGEEIQSYIANNAYPLKSLKKFLYPSYLDYTRKLNDMYAALWLVKHEAKKEGVDSRIEFHTYANNPTLRATFAYGENKILDFVNFPENWIGMTGTMFRCEVLNETSLNNRIFKKAEEERETMNLVPKNDLIEVVENELIERLDERGLNNPLLNGDVTKENIIKRYNRINQELIYESDKHEERRKFLAEITPVEQDKLGRVSPEPIVIVIPHM